MAVDLTKLFARNYEFNNEETELEFYQSEIGDVGCVVWDAALVLCKFLEVLDNRLKNKWQGKSIVEVGAGTGAVGLVAASLGANVAITDLPEFVPLMEHNIAVNQKHLKGSCLTQPLVWGDTEQAKRLVEARFTAGVDYVMLADCVYYEESIGDLVQTLRDLSNPSTTVYCSYEDRDIGNKEAMQQRFFELMRQYFAVCEIPPEEQDSQFCSPDIHILKFTQKNDNG